MANFIVADDHPLAVVAIKMLLESSGHTVVAETGNPLEIIDLIVKHNPDAMVLDIDMPGKDGIEVLRSLREKEFDIPVIMMSGKNADYYSLESLRYGANGFISKNNNLDDLKNAVHAVLSGYGYFPLRISDTMPRSLAANDGDKIRSLSSREFQVLKYLAEGTEIIEIAARLHISNKTVSTYKARLMDKLGLQNQRDLLNFARKNQIN